MTVPLPADGDTSWSDWGAYVHAQAAATVNVKAYGATGNGSTDDLAAINTAIAALTTGGTLLFPPGTYKTSATVLVRRVPGVTVRGYGATISCTAGGATDRVLSIESCVGATVSGLTLRHFSVGTRQFDADGLAVRRCSDFLIENVHVPYVHSVGIRVGGSIRGTVRDCHVRDNLADGIGVYGAVHDATGGAITSGTTSLTAATAYFTTADIGGFVRVTGAGAAGGNLTATITAVTGTDTVTLSVAASATVSNAAVKVVRHSEDVTIAGNHLFNTGDDSIASVGYLTLDTIAAAANRNVTVQGNTIRSSLARGIVFAGQNRGAISGNILDSIPDAGIYVTTEASAGGSFGSTDVQVTGNVLTGCNSDYPTSNYGSIGVGSGVDAYPTSGVSVHGNTIRGGGSYYIGVGQDSGGNTAVSTVDINVRDNHCLGGNGANAGINIVKSTDVSIVGNIIEKAYRSAISSDNNLTGVTLVAANNISQADFGAGGFQPISVVAGAVLDGNLLDGVLVGAPVTIAPPASTMYSDVVAAWWGANGAVLHRFNLPRPTRARYVNVHIGTSAGNIQVGVVKLNPTNLTAWTSMPMNSGVIAAPATGPQRVDCGTATLDPGEYALFFWASSTTLTTSHYLGGVGQTASRLILSGTYVGGLSSTGAGSFTNRYVGGLTLDSV